jgi:hypothetical protein
MFDSVSFCMSPNSFAILRIRFDAMFAIVDNKQLARFEEDDVICRFGDGVL